MAEDHGEAASDDLHGTLHRWFCDPSAQHPRTIPTSSAVYLRPESLLYDLLLGHIGFTANENQ